ncbi:hypothetical protein ACH4FX_37390 [Streptomyces sp. NPDC018019]|uniref:hypothetical protein n=1 Tax=Streptomyces sp. NPDC018019 TaxID=3365030 RepID=UPI0037A24A03
MQTTAVRDGELRAAMDGKPLRQQIVARQGDFLAALTRVTGSDNPIEAAEREIGVAPGTAEQWRRENLKYAQAEDAVLALVSNARRKPVAQVTLAMLDRAADALERGETVNAAARSIGLLTANLRYHARKHERLARLLPEPKKQGSRVKGKRLLTPGREQTLKSAWADTAISIPAIASRLGVHEATVYRWARHLDLPARSAVDL